MFQVQGGADAAGPAGERLDKVSEALMWQLPVGPCASCWGSAWEPAGGRLQEVCFHPRSIRESLGVCPKSEARANCCAGIWASTLCCSACVPERGPYCCNAGRILPCAWPNVARNGQNDGRSRSVLVGFGPDSTEFAPESTPLFAQDRPSPESTKIGSTSGKSAPKSTFGRTRPSLTRIGPASTEFGQIFDFDQNWQEIDQP